ncbi:MAG TPA: HNH endonuclease [Candidatus Eisenbacteria bacterium]|nr:HNH endonuclease [Candidatus Eisenbacteria bacterium]
MRPKWSSAVSSAPVRPGMSPISRKLNSIWGTLSLWHVLDAAHIKPCAKGGEHALTNGILLRQDLRTLLDLWQRERILRHVRIDTRAAPESFVPTRPQAPAVAQ